MTWPSYVLPIHETVTDLQRLAEKLDEAAQDVPRAQREQALAWAKRCRQLKGEMRFWIEHQFDLVPVGIGIAQNKAEQRSAYG